MPLIYWYGHTEIQRNPVLLERIIRNLGTRVQERLEADPKGEVIPSCRAFFLSQKTTGVGRQRSDVSHRVCLQGMRPG